MAEPNPNPTRVGPGTLWFAPLGTAEPTGPTATLDPLFLGLGYTEAGSTWNVDLTVVPLHVEEAYDPIRTLVTQRLMHMDCALAEVGPDKLRYALNAAAGTAVSTAGVTRFDPPDLGAETRGMLVWKSGSTPCDELILVRQVLQTGKVAIARKKAALSVININFQAEVPTTGLKPWTRWTTDSAFA